MTDNHSWWYQQRHASSCYVPHSHGHSPTYMQGLQGLDASTFPEQVALSPSMFTPQLPILRR